MAWLLIGAAVATTFTFTNKCSSPVWVGTKSGFNEAELSKTGFQLLQGSSSCLSAPPGWSGRFWGRAFCSTDSSGRFSCLSGDCSAGQVSCNGSTAVPPVTMVEITIGSCSWQDFYDVSLVDGYNLPISVMPEGGNGDCGTAGCPSDLNSQCPQELAVKASDGTVVACRSPCDSFADPKYCCTGKYNSPKTCSPTIYSKYFKNACPNAYSYAYDDQNSTFSCLGPESYSLIFCP
ncbi:hypothetical protein HPP92_022286 [Vanilla planifolia]|uniref:Thaumatin-like protein n=1 Tax=Vanilla planifolia TaxID=51239 RepID=A0A835PNV0_VANPL|nr:hypothetical protein HPP92_022602 [Vanilla planifolia]KAG0459158.1 hypothetical protein HPP92_022286 [Vanilla planifolia]